MNAIMATDRLPTDVVPLTSVITTVSYGTRVRVVLQYDERIFTKEIPIEALPQFITQRGNPGNINADRLLTYKFQRKSCAAVSTSSTCPV